MAKTDLSPQQLNKIISTIAFKPRQRMTVFAGLTTEQKVTALLRATHRVRQDIAHRLPESDLVLLLEKMDPDDATDILQLLPEKKREAILEQLSQGYKDTVTALLRFEPDTAAGLMTMDYIQIDGNDSIEAAAAKFQLHEKRTGRLPIILVVEGHRLAGILPIDRLVLASRSQKVSKFTKNIPTIHQSASHREVMEVFRSHPHNKVVVLDDEDTVIGIIYSDDVLRLLQEQASASLYNFAGVSAEESVADPAKRKIRMRYKWLIINLATAFLAAFTVGLFEETISKFVLLAVYMPIVAGMGGNAATQTLAVMVRGIALRQISLGTAWRTLRNEVGAGLANGLINGVLVAVIVIIKDNDPKIALVLALAMVINLIVAAAFGTIVPLVMSKLKKDPAASATIFITTATDVLGFLAFLGLAQAILS